jgi:hypothetical protein
LTAKKRNFKKSSSLARKLIAYQIDVKGLSLRRAARALHLRSHMDLFRMRDGVIADTPEMKAEIARRKLKARAAHDKTFFGMNGEEVIPMVPKQIVREQIESLLKFVEAY